MIEIECAACGIELDEPGGLLFSPPHAGDMVDKRHLCRPCYYAVLGGIRRYRKRYN